MSLNWNVAKIDDALACAFAAELGLSPVTAKVLLHRGLDSKDAVERFLDPKLADLPDPLKIPGMPAAIKRLVTAVKDKETIGIFGDYDVDGITGSALFLSFLESIGIPAFIELPNRTEEGYGLSASALDTLKNRGATLIVTIDNGTRSVDEVKYAKKIGLEVIVTDHHSPDGELPKALAVVNPKIERTSSEWRELSGCGVAFMLAIALRKELREQGLLPTPEPNLRQHLDLVALGTIADVVPLRGTNRILAKHGIEEIIRSTKPGIRALINVARTNLATLTAESIAFQLAPRLNAAGRLGNANEALDLVLSKDMQSAFGLAKALDNSNRERQQIEQVILSEAIAQLGPDILTSKKAGLVLYSEKWHVGVIGIAAAKLSQKFSRPAVVISTEHEPARGSARSAGGVDLLEALSMCSDSLVKFGGHTMAAGLSIEKGEVAAFSKLFDKACKKLAPKEGVATISVDAFVEPLTITGELIEELARLRPFGTGNPEPVFAMNSVDIASRIVLKDKHLKLRISAKGIHFDAIGFGMAEAVPKDVKTISIAFVPELSTYGGYKSVQLKLKDIVCSK